MKLFVFFVFLGILFYQTNCTFIKAGGDAGANGGAGAEYGEKGSQIKGNSNIAGSFSDSDSSESVIGINGGSSNYQSNGVHHGHGGGVTHGKGGIIVGGSNTRSGSGSSSDSDSMSIDIDINFNSHSKANEHGGSHKGSSGHVTISGSDNDSSSDISDSSSNTINIDIKGHKKGSGSKGPSGNSKGDSKKPNGHSNSSGSGNQQNSNANDSGSSDSDSASNSDSCDEGSIDISIVSIVKEAGYHIEVHQVTTKDGYILEVHRIPGCDSIKYAEEKKPVLLWHGLHQSSASFVLGGPDASFAFYLAKLGYDVWMGNSRGNVYAQKHVSLTSIFSSFWQFSLDEIANYDLPAVINYIIKTTKHQKVQLVGFDAGGTAMLIMMSLNPKLKSKIYNMNLIAPLGYMLNTEIHMILSIGALAVPCSYASIYSLIGRDEAVPNGRMMKLASRDDCLRRADDEKWCDNYEGLHNGYDSYSINTKLYYNKFFEKYHNATFTSASCVIHAYQSVRTNRFARTDYGVLANKKLYGTAIAPDYDLNNINVPVYIYHSNWDLTSKSEDLERLYNQLPDGRRFIHCGCDQVTHAEMIYSKKATKCLYPLIVQNMIRI